MNNGYYLGIDGGGTKSTAKMEFTDGSPSVRFGGGPLNICSVSRQEAEQNLTALLDQAASTAGPVPCIGVGIGLAGFTNPEARPFFEAVLQSRLPQVPAMLHTDAMAALYGAHGSDRGLVLISGTGSVCFGSKNGKTFLTGGCGHLLDDEGSGYSIGREILKAVLKAWDGRGPATELTSLVAEFKGFSTRSDIIGYVYSPETGKEDIAAFAPLLVTACQRKDEVSLNIADQMADSLLALVSAAAQTLEIPEGPLALSGSILEKVPFIRERFCKKLEKQWPDMVYYNIKTDAVSGAVLMARQAAGKGEQ